MTSVRIDDAALDRFLHHPEGPVARHTRDVARTALGFATWLAPVDTGFLQISLGIEETQGAMGPWYKVGSANAWYADVVELGDPENPDYPVQPYLRPALNHAIRGSRPLGPPRWA